jgi:hypothetical protein
VPSDELMAPRDATHFEIIMRGLELDLTLGTSLVVRDSTGVLPYGLSATSVLQLEGTVTVASTKVLMVMLGVTFYQSDNGTMYPLRESEFSPLTVVAVSQ